tara:strand:+ start:122 stop:709 length:588 start_codon:yes stop_codon:yes gene_type:complete
MKNFFSLLIVFLVLSGCGAGSKGMFGTGVSIALDPRTLGMQIDDSIMDKGLEARLIFKKKDYLTEVGVKVIDGHIFITGKVNEPEEKLQITKMAWETKGVRSVKNDIRIREKFKFKVSAKDVLITSQLKTALIFNKKIKSANYNIDTYKKKVYLYGIATDEDERGEVINEAKQIADVEEVVASILLVSDLSRQKE